MLFCSSSVIVEGRYPKVGGMSLVPFMALMPLLAFMSLMPSLLYSICVDYTYSMGLVITYNALLIFLNSSFFGGGHRTDYHVQNLRKKKEGTSAVVLLVVSIVPPSCGVFFVREPTQPRQ